MAGLKFIEPTNLYNMLNQGTTYPSASDPNDLLLIDARNRKEYNESHVITAKPVHKSAKGAFIVPYDAELECKTHVVVYDSSTKSLKEDGPAVECAKLLWELGSRNPVNILKGGYEDFSALYPFLRTQKIIFMPQELDNIKTYPVEIIPGFLYMGNWIHGNQASIQKDVKIKGHVNCSREPGTFFTEEGQLLMHIDVADRSDADLYCKFRPVCSFIDNHKERNNVILVFSTRGISRSATVIIAYLMHSLMWSLEDAYNHVLACCCQMKPNQGFIEQLLKWEKDLHGENRIDLSDTNL